MYLIKVPVEGGGRLLVQVFDAELPDDLQLASARPGQVVARARQSLDLIKPAVRAVLDRLVAMSPDEVCVGFGLNSGRGDRRGGRQRNQRDALRSDPLLEAKAGGRR